MKQVTDTGAIEKAIDAIIAANLEKVEQAKAKPTLLGWFVGQTMKATGGKANPQAVNEPCGRSSESSDAGGGGSAASAEIRIRPARNDDAQDLFGLFALCFADYPGCYVDPHADLTDLRAPGTAFSERGGAFFVVEDESGRVCGCIAVDCPKPGVGELHRLYVRPDRRGKASAACSGPCRGSCSPTPGDADGLLVGHAFHDRPPTVRSPRYKRVGGTRELGISRTRWNTGSRSDLDRERRSVTAATPNSSACRFATLVCQRHINGVTNNSIKSPPSIRNDGTPARKIEQAAQAADEHEDREQAEAPRLGFDLRDGAPAKPDGQQQSREKTKMAVAGDA